MEEIELDFYHLIANANSGECPYEKGEDDMIGLPIEWSNGVSQILRKLPARMICLFEFFEISRCHKRGGAALRLAPGIGPLDFPRFMMVGFGFSGFAQRSGRGVPSWFASVTFPLRYAPFLFTPPGPAGPHLPPCGWA